MVFQSSQSRIGKGKQFIWLVSGLCLLLVITQSLVTQPNAIGEVSLSLLEKTTIQALMAEASYYFAWHEADAFHGAPYYWAPNEPSGWQVEFAEDGVHIAPNSSADWHWNLRFIGYGYGEPVMMEATPTLEADKAQLVYEWDGNLNEWWANDPAGLEHGFTIQERPAGNEAESLVIEMALETDLEAVIVGDGIVFRDPAGVTILTYDELKVLDANGINIPARMTLHGNFIQLVINDTMAVYPLLIDPWIKTNQLTASDIENYDHFGRAVDIGGNIIVVGAPQSSGKGSAYVFVMPINGSPSAIEVAKLTQSGERLRGHFGRSVSIYEDTIVIGASTHDHGSGPSGTVFVFERPRDGWVSMTETARLIASDAAPLDYFGRSVSISGDTIVVGAYGNDALGDLAGAAYVYVKPEGGWVSTTETAKLMASDAKAGDGFGRSVSIDGNTIVVGAYSDDHVRRDSGSAYVFEKPHTGWISSTETAKLTASDAGFWDYFGLSVAIVDHTILVGAPQDTGKDGTHQAGSAYVFVRPPNGWESSTESAKLTPSNESVFGFFGFNLDMTVHTIAIGAIGDDEITFDSGAIFIFDKPRGGWVSSTETVKLVDPESEFYDRLGYSLGLEENTLVAGLFWRDVNGTYSGGTALIYQLEPTYVIFLPVVTDKHAHFEP